MKGLYLVLLLAGNLFSQTTTEAVVSDSTLVDVLVDGVTWYVPVDATDISETWVTLADFQDCKGDDLMFNYVSGRIQEINISEFGDKQASYYLIQAPEVLKAYQCMRKNRGSKYTIHQMAVRVNEWYQGGSNEQ